MSAVNDLNLSLKKYSWNPNVLIIVCCIVLILLIGIFAISEINKIPIDIKGYTCIGVSIVGFLLIYLGMDKMNCVATKIDNETTQNRKVERQLTKADNEKAKIEAIAAASNMDEIINNQKDKENQLVLEKIKYVYDDVKKNYSFKYAKVLPKLKSLLYRYDHNKEYDAQLLNLVSGYDNKNRKSIITLKEYILTLQK